MSGLARGMLAKIARRIYADPTSYTLDDVKRMAAGLLMLLEGKLPK